MDRLPHDAEAERAIIGALMLQKSLVWEVMPSLKPEHMYLEQHRQILDAMYDIAENGDGKVDVVSTRHVLDQRGKLQQIGGTTYLSSLMDALPDVANVGHYVGIVLEHALDREMRRLGAVLSQNGSPPKDRAHAVLADMYKALAGEESASVKTMAQIALEYESNVKAGLTEQWIETGISALDSWVTIRRKNQVVVAGNPSTGKSSFALQAALNAMKTHHVLFISLEMSEEELFERVVQGMTGCSAKVIANPKHTTEENRRKIAEAVARVQAHHHMLHLLSPGMVTPQDVIAHARAIQIRYGTLGLVVVDYLQLMHCPLKNMGTTERVTWLSRHMKAVARQLDVPVMLLSQLSRDNTRGNREPELHDLRDSGAIEQDADIVIFTHRQNLDEPEGVLLVRKQRHGPTGRTRVNFDGARSKFLTIHPTC